MLEALVSAHKIELIRIFLTKSRQDGDLQIYDLYKPDKLLDVIQDIIQLTFTNMSTHTFRIPFY